MANEFFSATLPDFNGPDTAALKQEIPAEIGLDSLAVSLSLFLSFANEAVKSD